MARKRLAPRASAADRLIQEKVPSRVRAKDASLFDYSEEALECARTHMGWTDLASVPPLDPEEIISFAREALDEGINYVGLLGQGGSSQAAMTITKLSAELHPAVRFSTLDSLSPLYIRQILHGVDYAKSLFIVSSKSGTTLETISMYKVIREDVVKELGEEEACRHFVAITDPGSELQTIAQETKFRGVFLGEPGVGGRFSALSVFGLVPAALCGLDIREILRRAAAMEELCAADTLINPALQLASFLLQNTCRESANCFTYISPQPGRVFGLWMEQLIAESLGKDGKGIVPHIEIDVNLLNRHMPTHPVVVYHTNPDPTFDRESSMLSSSIPQRSYKLDNPLDIGRHFVLWEYAVTFLGWLMRITPFNQPDVQATKTSTKQVLAGEIPQRTHRLEEPWVIAEYSEAFARDTGIVDPTQMHSVDLVIDAFMNLVAADNWISVNAFLPFTGERRGPMEVIRHTLARHLGVPTSLEIGPRYLHSTGQLQKGGMNNGLFLILSGNENNDLKVPGETYTLGSLEVAQSKGDLDALSSKGRRALHLHLIDTDAETLWHLAHAFEDAGLRFALGQSLGR